MRGVGIYILALGVLMPSAALANPGISAEADAKTNAEADALYDQAEIAIKRDEFAEAIRLIQRAQAIRPELSQLASIGHLRRKLKQCDEERRVWKEFGQQCGDCETGKLGHVISARSTLTQRCPPSVPTNWGSRLAVGGYMAAGLGVAGLVAGGMLSNSAQASADAAGEAKSLASYESSAEDARTQGGRATWSTVAGGVGLATAASLLLMNYYHGKSSVAFGPGPAQTQGLGVIVQF